MATDVVLERALATDGWMSLIELTWLASVARRCKTIIEVGSFCGRSTLALADNCPGVVHAVDPFPEELLDSTGQTVVEKPAKYRGVFERNLSEHLRSGKVVHHACDISELDPKIFADFAFIDGIHRYEAVKSDSFHAGQRLPPWGILAGHDYGAVDWPGVKQAVDELFEFFELVDTIWVVR